MILTPLHQCFPSNSLQGVALHTQQGHAEQVAPCQSCLSYPPGRIARCWTPPPQRAARWWSRQLQPPPVRGAEAAALQSAQVEPPDARARADGCWPCHCAGAWGSCWCLLLPLPLRLLPGAGGRRGLRSQRRQVRAPAVAMVLSKACPLHAPAKVPGSMRNSNSSSAWHHLEAASTP